MKFLDLNGLSYFYEKVKVRLGLKVDKITGKGLSSNDYTTAEKSKLASLNNFDPAALNTKFEAKVDKVTGKQLSTHDYTAAEKTAVGTISNKVDKITGKGLSANDYTAVEKTKLAGLNNYNDAGLTTLIATKQAINEASLTTTAKTVPAAINELKTIKVDKIAGKDLSSNDYTAGEKTKLASLNNFNPATLNPKFDGKVDKVAGKQLSTNDYTGLEYGKVSLIGKAGGQFNAALGSAAMLYLTSGTNNAALGGSALQTNRSGSRNTGLGDYSIALKTDGSDTTNLSNCTGVGANTRVSASNQVQLGYYDTNTYCYGYVQNRSDIRDKTDIRDTALGLEFISRLRPVDFKWDYRETYNETVIKEDGSREVVQHPKDGSRKRNRLHHGLIAQEVKVILDEMEIDFGGYQDHSLSEDGCDVLSIGYEELIAPMIKCIQELNARLEVLEKK